MDDDEWEKGMHRFAAALADRPTHVYRTWTLRVDGGKPTFELSEFDRMFDTILDEVYRDADQTAD